MRNIVVHHAHHPDEGVYKLQVATTIEDITPGIEPNPDFDLDKPESEENSPNRPVDITVLLGYADHLDFVWADDDERWRGMDPEEIAAEQRAEVKEALAASESEPAQEKIVEFEGVGEEL
jgi:hypothetical protein